MRPLYNWHRYYDPRIGRYITSDPIGLEGGSNTFSYGLNNPMFWTDPMGLNNIHVLPSWIPIPTGNPIYPNWFCTTNSFGIPTDCFPGSTKPDPKQPNCQGKNCPEILPGTYPFTLAPFPRTGTPLLPAAPLLGNDGTVPTRAPNPNNGNQSSATGIRIHPGLPSEKRRTGSEGCLTLDPNYWDDFMKGAGSGGNVTVW